MRILIPRFLPVSVAVCAVLFLFFQHTTVSAAEFFREPTSYRAAAMGGTGISSANDMDVLHYNPATLANIGTFMIDFAAAQIEADKGGREIMSGLKITSNVETQTIKVSGLDIATLLDTVENNNGLIRMGAKTQLGVIFPINREGFSIGFTASKYQVFDFRMDNLRSNYSKEDYVKAVLDPNSTIREELRAVSFNGIFRNDTIIRAGVSVPLFNGMIVLGAGVNAITRSEVAISGNVGSFLDSTADTDLIQKFDTDTTEHKQYLDAGLMIRIPGSWRIRLAGAARNYGGSAFKNVSKEKEEIAGGISMVPVFGKHLFGGVRITLAADYRDGLNNHDTSSDNEILKKVHAGGEIAFFPQFMTYSLLAIRGGYGQGYFSYGAETNLALGRSAIIGYASYGEEIGDNKTKRESRREVAYISIGF